MSQTPTTTPWQRQKQWLTTHLDTPWKRGGAGVVVAALLVAIVGSVFWLSSRGSNGNEFVDPPGFALSPEGDDVPRLAPIRVTFASPPDEKSPERLLQLEPAVPGTYAWLSDRTVLFQPDFPGLLRGSSYTVSVPARPETGLEKAVNASFTVTGLLTVQQAIPGDAESEVPLNAPILVQFSRSVAPLTTLDARDDAPVLTFDPPIEGQGEWLNTSIYRFVPAALQPFTNYKVVIPKGLTSAADGVLREDFTWSFTTLGPAVAKLTPDTNTEYASPTQTVRVEFNQPMAEEAKSGITLKGPAGAKVAGVVTWDSTRTVATFTPAARLDYLATYTAVVAAGLPGANGGSTPQERTSVFKTVGLPAVLSTQPPNGATNGQRYGVSIRFTNPMDEDSLEGKVSVSGFTADEVNTNLYEFELYVSVPLEPSTSYTVTLAPGAKDRYGQVLDGYTFSFTTGQLPSSVTLALPGYNSGGTYSDSADQILYFHATNAPQANFTLYPLTDNEGADLLYGGKLSQDWTPSLPAMRSWSVPTDGVLNEVFLGSTSLAGTGTPLPKGYYYVTSGGDWASYLAFAVVDTEIVTKISQDQLLAWVVDHETGKPVAGATVSASGAGITPTSVVTDADGVAIFSVPEPVPGKNIDRQYLVWVKSGGRFGFVSTRWTQGSAPYQLGIPTEFFVRQWVGQLYTDRPIYRPGETVEYKGVVRADDDAAYTIPATDAPLDFVIINSRGQEVKREAITTNEFGTFAGEFLIPGDAPVGDYSISIQYRLDGGGPFGGVAGNSFLVAEFRKPEFAVEMATAEPAYINGDSIDVETTATFYFGGGLEGAGVDWSVMAVPFRPTIEGLERYSFTDYDYWKTAVSETPIRATGKATTGPGGVASFEVPAALQANEGAQQFTISATVTDANAQAVASSTQVTVHPAAVAAGIRPAEYVAIAGEPSEIDLVAVDTEGAIVAGQPIVVRAYSRKWVTTKELTPDGARRYRSEPVDTLVETLNATSGPDGSATATFTPAATGTYRLVAEVTDAKGRTARSATYLWVGGKGYASWRITNDDAIALIADKDSYEVGDSAEILVPAPFENALGLVTVERGKIITHELRDFPTNSERLSIPIVDHSVPNIYVSTVLYRPPTAEDPVPRYKVGYVALSVSTSTRQLDVSIRPDRDQAAPGETVKYDIKVTDKSGKGVKAEVSVSVVDKALLALQDERGPDGLKAFWFERGLAVVTASSLSVSIDRSNDVIAEPPRQGKGGGGLEDDRLRQDFRNSAYWSAQLVTNDDGTASVEVKMPDNLTTWRMAVRAVSGNTMVGEGQNELVSTQPLLIRPALPRFLRVGDNTEIRTLVRNATKDAVNLRVSLDAEGLVLMEPGEQSISVGPGESKLVSWPASAKADGTARITFRASGGGLSDAVTNEFPVLLDVTPETTATGGIVTTEPGLESIYLPPFAILENGKLEVTLQSALAGSMADELDELAPREYEDRVRVASRLIATLGVARAEASGDIAANRDGQIVSDLASLVSSQRPDGGWSWCSSALCPSDPQVTAFVLFALGEARRDGRTFDDTGVARANSYLSSYLNQATDVLHPADPNRKALMLASIAAASGPEIGTPALTQSRALFEQYRTQLTNWGRAYLVLALTDSGVKADDAMIRALLNDIAAATIPSANGNHWEDEPVDGSFMTNTGTTALVTLALARVAPEQPLLAQSVRWLVVARGAQEWSTTVERAIAVAALTTYAVETQELGGQFSYEVQLHDKALLQGLVKRGQPIKDAKATVPLTDFTAGKASIIAFIRDYAAPGRLYYTLNLRYLTPASEVEALNRGFAISHQYSLLADPTVKVASAKLGDTVRVTMTILVPADRHYVVVEDLLPAGLEPIDPQLQTIDPALKAQLEAERRKAAESTQGGYIAPWFRWYWSPWQFTETRDDRTVLITDNLPKGVYEYTYYARATTPGDFFVGPAHAEETYFPETFGRSDSGRFVVEP
ncbi:MAG: Ig-like domain-containing protein [Tepidiformaceae bacterium]